jgi:hypothetical protein
MCACVCVRAAHSRRPPGQPPTPHAGRARTPRRRPRAVPRGYGSIGLHGCARSQARAAQAVRRPACQVLAPRWAQVAAAHPPPLPAYREPNPAARPRHSTPYRHARSKPRSCRGRTSPCAGLLSPIGRGGPGLSPSPAQAAKNMTPAVQDGGEPPASKAPRCTAFLLPAPLLPTRLARPPGPETNSRSRPKRRPGCRAAQERAGRARRQGEGRVDGSLCDVRAAAGGGGAVAGADAARLCRGLHPPWPAVPRPAAATAGRLAGAAARAARCSRPKPHPLHATAGSSGTLWC